MRFVRSLWGWAVIAAATILCGLPAIPMGFVPPRGSWSKRFGRAWARMILRGTGVRVRVLHPERWAPQGAVIAPYRAKEESAELETPPVGTFCWDELVTTAPDAAVAFYSDVFGWTSASMDMGPAGTYHILKRDGRDAAGVLKSPMPEAPPAWLAYVAVDDVDASARRAERLKAKVMAQPIDIPNVGRFAVLLDPTGAAIAVFKGAPKK